jgi:UDP-glucose 6-dehydrogenase
MITYDEMVDEIINKTTEELTDEIIKYIRNLFKEYKIRLLKTLYNEIDGFCEKIKENPNNLDIEKKKFKYILSILIGEEQLL